MAKTGVVSGAACIYSASKSAIFCAFGKECGLKRAHYMKILALSNRRI
jgi:hypothetical protein